VPLAPLYHSTLQVILSLFHTNAVLCFSTKQRWLFFKKKKNTKNTKKELSTTNCQAKKRVFVGPGKFICTLEVRGRPESFSEMLCASISKQNSLRSSVAGPTS